MEADLSVGVYHFSIKNAENVEALNNAEVVSRCLDELVAAANLTVLKRQQHSFSPQGLSILYLLSESHIAVHTWPEHGSAYITLTTCRQPGVSFKDVAHDMLQNTFGARVTLQEVSDV